MSFVNMLTHNTKILNTKSHPAAELRGILSINSKYHKFGFDMETTIVESGDHLPVPNHYTLYKS